MHLEAKKLLYYHIYFIAVVWNQTCYISQVCLFVFKVPCVLSWLDSSFFLLLSNIPLYGCTTVHPFTY